MAISSSWPMARSVKSSSGLSSGSSPFSMVYLLEEYVLVGEVTRKDRQAGAADGARLRADRALDDLGHDDALQVELGGFVDGGLHHPAAHPIGKAAVDDGRAEIDDRGGGNDRLRQRFGAVLDPGFHRLAEIHPAVGRIPER